MSVYGKSYWSWEYATYCNFGDSRKRRVSRHFSRRAADRAFQRLRKIYSHEGRMPDRENWRCWQENRAGDHIINDTGYINKLIYA